jgi:hypothetical protein
MRFLPVRPACSFDPHLYLKYEHRSQWTYETPSLGRQNVHARHHGEHAGSSRLTQLCSFTINKCSAPDYVISRKSDSRRQEKLCASLLPYDFLPMMWNSSIARSRPLHSPPPPLVRAYGFMWVNLLKGQSISRCLLSMIYRLKPSGGGGRERERKGIAFTG